MQILLSEQEYKDYQNIIQNNKDHSDYIYNFQNDLKNIFQVTAKGFEQKAIEVTDIKLDVSRLIEIIMKNCFDDGERKAINIYIDGGKRVKLSNVKMNEFDTDVFLNNVIDKIRKAQLDL